MHTWDQFSTEIYAKASILSHVSKTPLLRKKGFLELTKRYFKFTFIKYSR